MIEYIPLFKALHFVGLVGWFGGLFYLVRIFVYHTEAKSKAPNERDVLLPQFEIMESRAYRIICNPGMIVTWTFGVLMLIAHGADWLRINSWMHIKLMFVVGLTVYHWYCGKIITKLSDREKVMDSEKFRLFNEVPSVLLLIIVLLAVFRNTLDFGKASVYVLLFALAIFGLVKLYKRYRNNT